jgi:hypothetical protein
MEKERGFGWLAGIVFLIGVGMLVGFLIFSRAVYAFGFFGAFVLVSVAVLAFGWWYDHRGGETYSSEED